MTNLRQRITDALDGSVDKCARCKTCDNQVDAVMRVVQEEIILRVRLARRRETLERMEELDAPEVIIENQRRMVRETEEKLGNLDAPPG